MSIKISGDTGISGVDGSAATPALQGADSNTGVSFGTDTVTINTGGVARVTTDSSGNVGIGTNSPARKLHVSGGSFQVDHDYSASGTSFRILNDATPANGVNLVAEYYGSGAYGPIKFTTSNTERMRIDSSGNLLVGTTTLQGNGFTMYPTGSGGGVYTVYNRPATSNTTTALDFKNGGTTVGSISYTNTATSFNTSSDYRLKDNIAPMTGALAKVQALKPVTYKWKADGSDGEGFIAHELAEVVPQCVTGEKDAVDADGKPVYQGVDTSFLVATLTKAIQELKSELDSVKAELATLKGAA